MRPEPALQPVRRERFSIRVVETSASDAGQRDDGDGVIGDGGDGIARSVAPAQFTGIVSKTRVFGPGHWMATQSLLAAEKVSVLDHIGKEYVAAFHPANNDGHPDAAAEMVAKCKQLARDLKRNRPSRKSLYEDVKPILPAQKIITSLVQLYFATFESGYRILCRPWFMDEYDKYLHQPETARNAFLLQLLLVLAAAAPLHDDRHAIARHIPAWINIAQLWLSNWTEKDRLTVAAVQGHCLLLLARQVNRVGSDLVWISAGSLVRIAVQMGLHQDPDCFEDMPLRQKEIRRRLWYTVLEMDAQAALDSGVAPQMSADDYKTRLPSTRDDDDFGSDNFPNGRHEISSHSVQSSCQRYLSESLPLRLRLLRTVNRLQNEVSYEEILALENELTNARQGFATALISRRNAPPAERFAANFCAHLLGRFSLCLHFRHALQSARNPVYSYSQKVCLRETLGLIALLGDDLYSRLLVSGGGMFRDIITRGAAILFIEISSELKAMRTSFIAEGEHSSMDCLLDQGRQVVEHSRNRLVKGDTNIKTFVTASMMMAQADAQLHDRSPQEAIRAALYESLQESHVHLSAMSDGQMTTGSGLNAADTVDNALPLFPSSFDADFDFLDSGLLGPDSEFSDLLW